MGGIVQTHHAEFAGKTTVFVIRGGERRGVVDRARVGVASVERGLALAADGASVVCLLVLRPLGRDREAVGLCAIVCVVVVNQPCGRVAVGAVDGQVLADKADLVPGLGDWAVDEHLY